MEKLSALPYRPNETVREPIAIIGIGCRFPGHITSPTTFWQFLTRAGDGIGKVPAERWNESRFHDASASRSGMIKTHQGGFVDDFDQFDANFFGLFPSVAAQLDPQQRFLLEVTYEAFQDAGVTLDALSGSDTAVYAGVFMNDYWDMQADSRQRHQIGPHTAMGAARTSAANRISYLYNLQGPSVTLDTACSSSLVAIHQACQSLWLGESRLALAGGVNIMCRPETSIMLSQGNFLSPDGYCKSFDSRANGYVRSEGCGMVLLKPLSQAETDGDDIYAVIRGSAVNQDGYTEAGFTVPSRSAQVAMLKTAYQRAGVDPRRVAYLEAHGTGTPVGDPIETAAFGEVIGKGRNQDNKCWVGSVKSNFGHTEAAAGVAGLIKLALVLKHGQIPANLHFEHPNPKIPFDDYRLRVPTALVDLPGSDTLAIGGVNSFGAGGTNAHVVLQAYASAAYPPPEVAEEPQSTTEMANSEAEPLLFVLSARSEAALRAITARYVDFLADTTDSLTDVCYSAAVRRSHFTHRLAVATRSKAELHEKLQAYLTGETRPGLSVGKAQSPGKIGFIFSGQGPQWYAMGQQLLQSSLPFRAIIERIDALFQPMANWSLLAEMNRDEASSRVSETRIAQPAIMALQIGLVELWKQWGVVPEGCVGHSIGEVAAAYTAGALTLEQAVAVIYHRSRGQHQATDKGKMLAAALTVDEARAIIADDRKVVSVAAVNGPAMLTLSGDAEPLERIAAELEAREVFHRFLRVNVPFHSHHMEPLKQELIDSLADLTPSPAQTPLYSTVTGQPEDGTHLVSDYWYRNVREPVYFTDAIAQMARDGFTTFVEIAPHPVLTTGALDLLKQQSVKDALIVPSLRRKEDEALTMMGSVGKLYTQGVGLGWQCLNDPKARYVKLPTYVWQHQRYWFESSAHAEGRLTATVHPHVRRLTHSATQKHLIAALAIRPSDNPYLLDHKVEGSVVFPGTAHLETAQAVVQQFNDGRRYTLRDIRFKKALFLPEPQDEAWQARMEVSEVSSEELGYRLLTRSDSQSSWQTHSQGAFGADPDPVYRGEATLPELQQRINHPVPVSDFYLELKESGLQYGKAFRNVRKLWVNTDQQEILSQLQLPAKHQPRAVRFGFHPALLDACLHTIEYAGKWTNPEEKSGIYLPTHIGEYRQFASPAQEVYTYVRLTRADGAQLRGEFVIFNADGSVVAELREVHCQYIAGSRGEVPLLPYEGMYDYAWQAVETSNGGEHLDGRVNGDATGGCVLISGRAPGLVYEQLLARFRQDQLSPMVIRYGKAFEEKSPTHYTVASQSDLEVAFQRIKDHGYRIARVLYTPDQEPVAGGYDPDTAQWMASQRTLAAGALSTLRGLVQLDPLPEVHLLTQGGEVVVNSDQGLNPHQAPLAGMGRVLKNEYPEITATLIDLSASPTEAEITSLYDYFTRQQRPTYSQLAFRNAQHYRPKLCAVLQPNAYPSESPLNLSAEVTYLITGGASGFGLMLAEWLVSKGARHLILLSRSGHKHTDDYQTVGRMEAQGAEVYNMKLDITDIKAVQGVVDYVRKSLPPLRGIIHSAAVLQDATLLNTDAERYMRVFRPKAQGAWNLHLATASDELDFFLTLSSVSSVFGLPGQTSYASANSFLDKLAAYRQGQGLRASSVNLGVLGLYAGMSRDGASVMKVLNNQGWIPMELDDVLGKIERILHDQPAQRVAARLDWSRFGDFFPHLRRDDRFATLIGQEASVAGEGRGSLRDNLLKQPTSQQVEQLTGLLAKALGRIVGASGEEIDTTRPVTQLGLDSLMLSQLRNWIQQQLEISYPLMRIAKGPSLRELAGQLADLLGEEESSPTNSVGSAPADTSGITSETDIEVVANGWLVRRRRQATQSQVAQRIFCIHPVGAGASMFSYFIYQAPADTEVMAFQLPGRENRREEAAYTDMKQLIEEMGTAIQPYLDKPFVVIGHSFGGVIGYEMINYLIAQNAPAPQRLVVTGTIAPQLTTGWKRTEAIAKTAKRSFSEEKIINILNYIDDVDFLRSILPVMRNDMPLIMSYVYQPKSAANYPVTAFAAHQDEVVTVDQVKAWEKQTKGEFQFEVVNGDHWFLSRNQELILRRLLASFPRSTILV